MRDVLRSVHPKVPAGKEWQRHLFEWITWENEEILHNLPMIGTRKWLYSLPESIRRSYVSSDTDTDAVKGFSNAGMTWENVSEWYPEGMNASAWEAIIPSMGYMALLRNLRNFDEAGISRESKALVESKLRDPAEVARSRQLPYRFYSAFRAVESVRWGAALDDALTYSLRNVPSLRGQTLVLVDRSDSMFQSRVSDKSDITYAQIAALFGSAWKLANPSGVDLFEYGTEYQPSWVDHYQHR